MLELILTEVASGLGLAGITHAAKTIRTRLSESNPLEVRSAGLAQYLPRREALFKPISESDLALLDFTGFLDGYIRDNKAAPIDCAEVNVRVRNVSKSLVSITGLGVNRRFIEELPSASFLSIPQGRPISGECYMFAVDLNADLPTVKRFELVDGSVTYWGDDRFFDSSSIELQSGDFANLKFALLARMRPVEVSLYLRYETNRGIGTIDIQLDNPIRVFPLSSVPESSRYRRTYNEKPPVIALESDERFPDRNHKTRWEI